jgi:hypothetical protein
MYTPIGRCFGVFYQFLIFGNHEGRKVEIPVEL